MTENYSKLYICVLDEAPDYIVPTLVAHSVLGAHLVFSGTGWSTMTGEDCFTYGDWLHHSFRKVVVKVNRKEYDKIKSTLVHYEGYEKTICNGEGSCLVVLPVDSDNIPNVLKYAKLWKPN